MKPIPSYEKLHFMKIAGQFLDNHSTLTYTLERGHLKAKLAELLEDMYTRGYNMGLNKGWIYEQDKYIN